MALDQEATLGTPELTRPGLSALISLLFGEQKAQWLESPAVFSFSLIVELSLPLPGLHPAGSLVPGDRVWEDPGQVGSGMQHVLSYG